MYIFMWSLLLSGIIFHTVYILYQAVNIGMVGFAWVPVILSHFLWVKRFQYASKETLEVGQGTLTQDLSGRWALSCCYVGIIVGQSDHKAAYLGLLHTKSSLVFSDLVASRTELLYLISESVYLVYGAGSYSFSSTQYQYRSLGIL